MRKFGLMEKVIDGETYYYEMSNTFNIYDKDGNKLIQSTISNISQCSSIELGYIYIANQTNQTDESLKKLGNIIKEIWKDKTILSRQNVTKSEYDSIKRLGFEDLFRVPGSYTSTGGIYAVPDSCISLMVMPPKKHGRNFIEVTKKLLGQGDEVEKSKKGKIVCIDPTPTLTKHKLYYNTSKAEDTYTIVNDNDRVVHLTKNRFIEIID